MNLHKGMLPKEPANMQGRLHCSQPAVPNQRYACKRWHVAEFRLAYSRHTESNTEVEISGSHGGEQDAGCLTGNCLSTLYEWNLMMTCLVETCSPVTNLRTVTVMRKSQVK
jgi:hypothetical protein